MTEKSVKAYLLHRSVKNENPAFSCCYHDNPRWSYCSADADTIRRNYDCFGAGIAYLFQHNSNSVRAEIPSQPSKA